MKIGRAAWRCAFVPADSGALDRDCDLALLQSLALFNFLLARLGLGNPKVVGRVGVDANVGL